MRPFRYCRVIAAGLALVIWSAPAEAQFNPAAGPGGQQGFGFPGQQTNQANPAGPGGGPGGGVDADFDSLIDLIVSTVASETWAENGGGEAEIRPYVNGVHVDAEGTLRRVAASQPPDQIIDQLVELRRDSRITGVTPAAEPGDARRPTGMRCVSLVRLEREIARRLSAGEPLDEAMLTLAGLRRVQFVLLYPPTGDQSGDQPGDLAIAGPAGDWRAEGGRLLATGSSSHSTDERNTDASGAVVRLDDLIEVLRHTAMGSPNFGCTINPRAAALADAQRYITAAAAKPLRPGARQREAWLEGIRSRVGKQDIEYFDIDPTTHVAQVIIAADHHMKLIGMGLADGVVGVESYLDSIDIGPGEAPPAFGVLRWWFAMNYAAVYGSPGRDAFEISGPGVKVLSENQLLTERGQRVPTGQTDELTARFASTFTASFAALCAKYPLYSELRNVFDLSLAMTLIRDQRLAARAGWRPTLFAESGSLPLPSYPAPRTVDTVANHRLINGKHVVAGVSGGVDVSPQAVIQSKGRPAADRYGPVSRHRGSLPDGLPADAWWWDVE